MRCKGWARRHPLCRCQSIAPAAAGREGRVLAELCPTTSGGCQRLRIAKIIAMTTTMVILERAWVRAVREMTFRLDACTGCCREARERP